jgi:tellurite resistance protein TehA-like permease
MFWATATWWLPLLLMLGAWRHGVKGYPITYDHGYWGAVFPLGMYAVCTLRMAREFGLPFLVPLGEAFAWVSLAAWAATAIGLARRLAPRRGDAAVPPTDYPPGGGSATRAPDGTSGKVPTNGGDTSGA